MGTIINKMKVVKKLQLTILVAMLLGFKTSISQTRIEESKFVSIKSLYHIVDTIKTKDKTSLTLTVSWMDSVIEIRKTTIVKYDLVEMRKFGRDPAFVPKPEDTIRFKDLRKTFSQNCHSYALEKYFVHQNISDNALFTEWTSLTENKYMERILSTSFQKMSTFNTKRRKCKDCFFSAGTIIVFRNKWNSPIHTVYYDGKFHSKYGGWAAKAESHIESILKVYWDTKVIEEYRLDYGKVRDFISVSH